MFILILIPEAATYTYTEGHTAFPMLHLSLFLSFLEEMIAIKRNTTTYSEF